MQIDNYKLDEVEKYIVSENKDTKEMTPSEDKDVKKKQSKKKNKKSKKKKKKKFKLGNWFEEVMKTQNINKEDKQKSHRDYLQKTMKSAAFDTLPDRL